MELGRVFTDGVIIGERMRQVDEAKVTALSESMTALGLQQPISIWIDKDERPVLVAGRHRLAAAVRLGWREIQASIFDGTALDAELWEIDENLCRAELSEIERGRALARRKEIYEIKHPETKPVNERGGPGRGKTTENISAVSFAADTAAKTGKTERAVRNSVRIGEKLTPQAEEVAKAVGLDDNQSALLAAAKHTSKEDQIAELRQKAKAKSEKKQQVGGRAKIREITKANEDRGRVRREAATAEIVGILMPLAAADRAAIRAALIYATSGDIREALPDDGAAPATSTMQIIDKTLAEKAEAERQRDEMRGKLVDAEKRLKDAASIISSLKATAQRRETRATEKRHRKSSDFETGKSQTPAGPSDDEVDALARKLTGMANASLAPRRH